jgi:hypothetical protein
MEQVEEQLPGGHAASAEDQQKRIIRIGRREVFLFLGGTIIAVAIGSYAWHASKYYFQDKKYRSLADKAVEGIHAIRELADTIDDSDISVSS